MEKKTPLYDVHVEEEGKIVPFAGYLLPVQYPTGIIAEHEAVRTGVGMFDVSHMGEIMFTGPGALASLNHLITNDYTNLAIGRVRYGVLCNEDGGCLDDLIVYRLGEEEYFVVVNASNRDKDFAHMKANLLPDTVCEDISDSLAQIALQGPKSREVMAKICDAEALPVKYYSCVNHLEVAGIDALVSQTGYTGEFGYEIYVDAAWAPATRCASRPRCPSTATRWMRPSARSRQASAWASSSTAATSSAVTPWWPPASPPASASASRSPARASPASTRTSTWATSSSATLRRAPSPRTSSTPSRWPSSSAAASRWAMRSRSTCAGAA